MSVEKIQQARHAGTQSAPAVLPPIPTNGAGLSRVLVLTKADLERLNTQLNKHQLDESEVREKALRRKELHEKSLALTRNWTNTIEGSRKLKLKQKKIREDKQEEERRFVDLEHAEYMAEERKKALEQAKLLQYYETDRIKTFHSALKYSEVLKEREAQIELKALRDRLRKEEEEETEKRLDQMAEEKARAREEHDKLKYEQYRQVREYHKVQIREHMEKASKEKDEIAEEARKLEELKQKYLAEQEQLRQIKHTKLVELKEQYDRTLESKKRMEQAERRMDDEENDEIRVYAAAKVKMARMKQEREDEMEREKLAKRERMMAYIGSMMKQQVSDEDFRIAKALAKLQAKQLQEEHYKEQKVRQELTDIHRHRQQTIKRKEEDRVAKERQDLDHLRKQVEADAMFHMYEQRKDLQRRQAYDLISKNNLKLAKETKEKENSVKKADRDYVLKELELVDMEDKQFETYANKVIGYMDAHGRNTIPMKKVVHEALKKGAGEDDDKALTSEAAIIKSHQNQVPTRKNLGFNL